MLTNVFCKNAQETIKWGNESDGDYSGEDKDEADLRKCDEVEEVFHHIVLCCAV